MPVGVVTTKYGQDIGPQINALADREQMDARGFLGLLIAESNLDEIARRPKDPMDDLAYWPDVSVGLGQQTVLYAKNFGIGDGTSSRQNIDYVAQRLWQDVPLQLDIAARQWGAFYRLHGDWREACAKYNGGGGATWGSIPAENRANYERGYAEAAKYMADTPSTEPTARTYDPDTPRVLQTDSFSCCPASTTWALHSLGIPDSYPSVEQAMIDEGLVSPAKGLLSASGQPLAAWLRLTYGLPVEVNSDADWAWITERAGRGPILLGGRTWGGEGHWSGCRGPSADGGLALANPSPGWGAIWNTLYEGAFDQRGGWTALYITAEDAEDPMWQEKYTELDSWVSSLLNDTLRPTIADLRTLARQTQPGAKRDKLTALADRLQPFVGDKADAEG